MIQPEVLITAFVVGGIALIFAVSRGQARARREHESARSRARILKELKRMQVHEPDKVTEDNR